MGKHDIDNRADQLNPNNDAYWSSRGWDERPDDYSQLESFWDKQKKVRFVHTTIRTMMDQLTIILGIAWILFLILYGIAYFYP